MENTPPHPPRGPPSATQLFQGRVAQSVAGMMETNMLWLGDQLGLFKYLAKNSPTSLEGMAIGAKVNKRYLKEWLCGMVSAKFITYDAANGLYSIPPDHIPVLADEYGPHFMGGMIAMMTSGASVLPRLKEVFVQGGGVSQSEYPPEIWEGMERHTGVKFENDLVSEWIELTPDVKAKLSAGGSKVCDVGCGNGRAITLIAKAFPNNTYIGYDIFEPSLEKGAKNAEAKGVASIVSFKKIGNSADSLPDKPFDIVFVFDVVHDAAEPLALLKAIRGSLKDDGICFCLDIKCHDNPEQNNTTFYGVSLCYCMTTSLSQGGVGLGTCGLTESIMRELGAQAGFKSVRRVDIRTPLNVLWELRA